MMMSWERIGQCIENEDSAAPKNFDIKWKLARFKLNTLKWSLSHLCYVMLLVGFFSSNTEKNYTQTTFDGNCWPIFSKQTYFTYILNWNCVSICVIHAIVVSSNTWTIKKWWDAKKKNIKPKIENNLADFFLHQLSGKLLLMLYCKDGTTKLSAKLASSLRWQQTKIKTKWENCRRFREIERIAKKERKKKKRNKNQFSTIFSAHAKHPNCIYIYI